MTTLTEMLRVDLNMTPESDPEAQAIESELIAIKATFKAWLRTVGLPIYYSINRDGNEFNTTMSLRRLLITLVDEP